MKLKGKKNAKVPARSRSNSVFIRQHQHQHGTAKLRNSDDAREEAVLLAGLGKQPKRHISQSRRSSRREGERAREFIYRKKKRGSVL